MNQKKSTYTDTYSRAGVSELPSVLSDNEVLNSLRENQDARRMLDQ